MLSAQIFPWADLILTDAILDQNLYNWKLFKNTTYHDWTSYQSLEFCYVVKSKMSNGISTDVRTAFDSRLIFN